MEKNTKGVEAQGAETKTQKVSASYTVKAFSSHIEKLSLLNLLTAEDYRELNEIRTRVITKYMEVELGLK